MRTAWRYPLGKSGAELPHRASGGCHVVTPECEKGLDQPQPELALTKLSPMAVSTSNAVSRFILTG